MSQDQHGRRNREPVMRDLLLEYERCHRALKDSRPTRSGAELVPELQELAIDLKEASLNFNTIAKHIITRSIELGSVAQASEIKSLRNENNALTRSYLDAINDDLGMADADLVSNITNTTGTSQLSDAAKEERRLTLYTALQKSKAAKKFDNRRESLEQERLALERESRRQASEAIIQRDQLELRRMEREAQIELEKRQLEKEKEQELMEAELAVLSQTGDQLAALEGEIIPTVTSTGDHARGNDYFVGAYPSLNNGHPLPEPPLSSMVVTTVPFFTTGSTFVTSSSGFLGPRLSVSESVFQGVGQTGIRTQSAPSHCRAQLYSPPMLSAVSTASFPSALGCADTLYDRPLPLAQGSGSTIGRTNALSRPPTNPLAGVPSTYRTGTFAQTSRAGSTSIENTLSSDIPQPLRCGLAPSGRAPYTTSSLDSPSGFLMRRELFTTPTDPFKGSGQEERFFVWVALLENKLQGLSLTPMDQINVLLANTTGEANALINNYLAASASDPSYALNMIWEKLRQRYGTGESVGNNLRRKLEKFPIIRGDANLGKRLREMEDLCLVVNAHIEVVPSLQGLNYGNGLQPIRDKLPEHLQSRWRRLGSQFKAHNQGRHPPFSVFLQFLTDAASEYSDPSFAISHTYPRDNVNHRSNAFLTSTVSRESLIESESDPIYPVMATNALKDPPIKSYSPCIIHNPSTHTTGKCRSFFLLTVGERRKIIQEEKLCNRCLGRHLSDKCSESKACGECQSTTHHTLLHQSVRIGSGAVKYQRQKNDDESSDANRQKPEDFRGQDGKTSLCSTFCGRPGGGKSCSKTLLVDVTTSNSSKKLRCYVILDEQSNTTFADPKIFEFFNIREPSHSYTISTLTGHRFKQEGRIAKGLLIQGVGESQAFSLPGSFENRMIPDSRNEVATPDAVCNHRHIAPYAQNFHPLDQSSEVLLLIGRDAGEVMATVTYGGHHPFAHHTALGWAVVGSICPNNLQYSSQNHGLQALRSAIDQDHDHSEATLSFPSKSIAPVLHHFENGVFKRQTDDELDAPSQEDTKFLEIIGRGIHVNVDGHLEMPLPFRKPSPNMPSNQRAVYLRTKNTLERLKKDPEKLEDCLQAMSKTMAARQVEQVPDKEASVGDGKVWWIPVFAVVHPKKKKARLVFDSSAEYHGACLNRELLQGPDQNNRLKGVLTRFREGEIGFVADIESMFHSFYVNPEHRDYLRFYWFKGNDPDADIVQFRANVHIFGNRPSPAVASFGMRFATAQSSSSTRADTKSFLQNNFYVDDGLGCSNRPEDAIQVLSEARSILAKYNIRLHKIASSSHEVLEAFPKSERAGQPTQIKLDNTQIQRTLGVVWDTTVDSFEFMVDIPTKSFTKRGILATVNSIFDPIGPASPIILGGRLIQRLIISNKANEDREVSVCGWDDPLPERFRKIWDAWKVGLESIHLMSIPRGFWPKEFGRVERLECHVFADACKDAIGYVGYLRSVNNDGSVYVAFLFGDSKVAPKCATSIPRLELCAAVEAVQAARESTEELARKPDQVMFYSDSLVVLGYLNNSERRFRRYVARRVELILSTAPPQHWQYIETSLNPADMASRPQTPQTLAASSWLRGPDFLWSSDGTNPCKQHYSPLKSEDLPEVDQRVEELIVLQTIGEPRIPSSFLRSLLKRLSSWTRLINVVKRTLEIARFWLCKATQSGGNGKLVAAKATNEEARILLLKEMQGTYHEEIRILRGGVQLPKDNRLLSLAPFLDDDGLLRVGGRLKNGNFSFDVRCPILIPQKHPGTQTIIHYHHSLVKHQGRHITIGAIRGAGFHIEKGNATIKTFLSNCTSCRRLRGRLQTQLMSDLPPDRLESAPPFTNTGLDVFGPFLIHDGRTTRRTSSQKKTWAVLFTCLVTRAIHIEMLPSMDTPSFKNSLRRFLSVRGACKVIRSDRGTNFIGSLNQDSEVISLESVQATLEEKDCKWYLNPPNASHHGGVWERKIGSVRRILEASLLPVPNQAISRDELHTLLMEACAIVNSTPLWEVSSDPSDPLPLSPAMLLTLKTEPHPPNVEFFSESDIQAYGKRRWRRVQAMADEFWRVWRAGYLSTLQERRKWMVPKRSISVGDIVLLKDKAVKRNQWPTARVHDIKVGFDGLVRTATLIVVKRSPKGEIKRSFFERSINDLVLLVPES